MRSWEGNCRWPLVHHLTGGRHLGEWSILGSVLQVSSTQQHSQGALKGAEVQGAVVSKSSLHKASDTQRHSGTEIYGARRLIRIKQRALKVIFPTKQNRECSSSQALRSSAFPKARQCPACPWSVTLGGHQGITNSPGDQWKRKVESEAAPGSCNGGLAE